MGLPGADFIAIAGAVVVAVATLAAGIFVAVATLAPVPGRRVPVDPATLTPVIVFSAGFTRVAIVGAGSAFVAVGFAIIAVPVSGRARAAVFAAGMDFTATAVGVPTLGAGLAASFAAGFLATAMAPDSSVEAVTRPELEPPAVAARNDQPGCDDLAAAKACCAGFSAAGTGFAAAGAVAFAFAAGGGGSGINTAFGPEEATGRAAVVRSMRSALVGGVARTVAGVLVTDVVGFMLLDAGTFAWVVVGEERVDLGPTG